MEFLFFKSCYNMNQGCYEKTVAMWSPVSDTTLSINTLYVVNIGHSLVMLLLASHLQVTQVTYIFIYSMVNFDHLQLKLESLRTYEDNSEEVFPIIPIPLIPKEAPHPIRRDSIWKGGKS